MADGEPNSVAALLGGRREYKTFAVVKSTGEILSMKIRELSRT